MINNILKIVFTLYSFSSSLVKENLNRCRPLVRRVITTQPAVVMLQPVLLRYGYGSSSLKSESKYTYQIYRWDHVHGLWLIVQYVHGLAHQALRMKTNGILWVCRALWHHWGSYNSLTEFGLYSIDLLGVCEKKVTEKEWPAYRCGVEVVEHVNSTGCCECAMWWQIQCSPQAERFLWTPDTVKKFWTCKNPKRFVEGHIRIILGWKISSCVVEVN